MKTFLSLVFAALIFPASNAWCDEPSVPPIVARGFDELEKNGSLAAMAVCCGYLYVRFRRAGWL